MTHILEPPPDVSRTAPGFVLWVPCRPTDAERRSRAACHKHASDSFFDLQELIAINCQHL